MSDEQPTVITTYMPYTPTGRPRGRPRTRPPKLRRYDRPGRPKKLKTRLRGIFPRKKRPVGRPRKLSFRLPRKKRPVGRPKKPGLF